MLLVIPAMEISGGRCVQPVRGVEGYTYSDDPVGMAKLWRTENAKSLHVTDLDSLTTDHLVNAEVIGQIISAVDIPVEIGGPLQSFEAVRQAFELGAYRVVVACCVEENTEEVQRWMQAFGASKIVLGIDAVHGRVVPPGETAPSDELAVDMALRAKSVGFRRLLYTEVRGERAIRGLNLSVLREIGESTGLRITQSGGVSGLDELLALQELESVGVDSVVIGRALCENKFACQGLWRRCEAGNYPYTAKV
jgi:phosphoribosylformimino-5-aminoimidazole carboxamide ribotide isomerase